MDKHMFVINIIKAIADVIISALGIMGFIYGANVFQRWWILLFAVIPLLMYYSSGIVVIGDPVEEGGEDHS